MRILYIRMLVSILLFTLKCINIVLPVPFPAFLCEKIRHTRVGLNR